MTPDQFKILADSLHTIQVLLIDIQVLLVCILFFGGK